MKSILFPYHRATKILGLIVLVFGLSGFILTLITRSLESALDPATKIISLGLIFIFFSKEKIDDERIHQIKFRALSLGVLYGYFLTIAVNYFSYELTAPDFLSIVMAFTTCIYYYAKRKL